MVRYIYFTETINRTVIIKTNNEKTKELKIPRYLNRPRHRIRIIEKFSKNNQYVNTFKNIKKYIDNKTLNRLLIPTT